MADRSEDVAATDHTGALSWRDVYRAVSESEERIVQAVKDSTAPLRLSLDDHELRIRRIEFEGSSEAKEAHRIATADAIRLDAVVASMAVNSERRRGMLDTLSGGQKIVLVALAILGGLHTFLDIFSRFLGGP